MSRRSFVRLAGAALAFLVASCLPSRSPAPATSVPAPTGSAAPPSTPSSPPAASPGPSSAAVLRAKIARLLVVGFRGFTVDEAPWIRDAIRDRGLGGVILYDEEPETGNLRNIQSPAQVSRLISDLRAFAPERQLIVAIDQEGGIVTRLSPRRGFPAVASEAEVGEEDRTAVRAWADGIAGTLASVGVNLNLAPVADVDVNPDNPAIGALGRSFSADPAIVGRDAAIEIRAHHRKAVRTTLKHFPGLGSATVNTDNGIADVTTTWTPAELDPYRVLLADGLVDVVMAAHVVNGQIDEGVPASLSRATVTDLLRGELGFEGVVITDDMHAAAIRETFGFEAAVGLALEAGVDLLLVANQQVRDPTVVEKVIGIVERLIADGRLSEARIDESVARLERLFPPAP